ncbi:hypothetical protein [Salibaculum sp.]|uniref:hypothetical protein n=1 Tax=Salibaculum sp. TaxID=2855480 RepID=UPI002B4A0D5C|nr:hypothetical protein [Salibaculum sp.]HKL70816.1 hypothetical protein [Salibaculum sp.]
MKITLAAAAIAGVAATSAGAGGMAPAIEMEPDEIVAQTGSSSANLIIPLILIALIAAAAGSSSNHDA